MKKLGLIGGTGPESTIIYYKELTAGVQRRMGQDLFPHLTIESLSVFEVLDFCEKGQYRELAAYLAAGIRNLAAAGAEFAAFTGITPHIVFAEVARQSPIPIVSMVQTSYQYAAEKQYKRVALLGTLPTMNGDFFQRPFREGNIAVLTPNEAEKRFLHEKIASELEYGIVTASTQERLKDIANRLIQEEQAEAIILGCTELPLAFDGIALPVEKMDVMRIHIDALIDRILESE